MTENRLRNQVSGVLSVPGDGQCNLSPTSQPQLDFGSIFDREFAYVWRALARLGVRTADLEDLTHEVFLRVYRELPTCDTTHPLRPWLFAFAFRVASSHRRLARHRLEVVGNQLEPPDPAPAADEALARREAQQLVDRALGTLELEQRAVFVLHELEGCSIPDVAVALGVPLNTAYSRLRLARGRFAAAVHRLRPRGGER
jgi:RNA polymerase sigma-70 factor (ECF subfamily)